MYCQFRQGPILTALGISVAGRISLLGKRFLWVAPNLPIYLPQVINYNNPIELAVGHWSVPILGRLITAER